MMTTGLQHAAEMFVTVVRDSDHTSEFAKAQAAFHNDPELRTIRKRFNERSTELQTKQSKGTLTQEEINELRALQSSLNAHPATIEYIQTRQKMVATLQECNRSLSQELGFDFASAASPASCCG